MENKHQQPSGIPAGSAYTEKWFSEEFALPIGLFHLTFDGQWRCHFAGDDCFRIVGCGLEEFLERFRSLPAQRTYHASPVAVEELLCEAVQGQEPGSFLVACPVEGGGIRDVKATLTLAPEENGVLHVLGQMVDLTTLEARDAHFQSMEEVYRSSVEMSGRTMYRYMVEGRRGIMPPGIARRRNIPEVIDDLPAWNVACGRIAPQSVEAWLGIFDAIDRGEHRGAVDVIFSVRGGQLLRRGRVEFLTSVGPDGKPVSAVVSHQDITDSYEQDLRHSQDRAGLLQVACMIYPEIISVNLTEGTYRMIQYYGATTLGTPQEGDLDQLLLPRLANVAPEDKEPFRRKFFVEGLRKAVDEGKTRIQLTYRRRGADGVWHWMETTAVRQTNPYDSDVLLFAVSRNVDQEKSQEELLRQALADSVEKLDDWTYYNSLSSQIFPGLIYVDCDNGQTTPFSVGMLAQKLDCPSRELALGTCFRIPQEDREMLEKIKRENAGVSELQVEYRVEMDRGEIAWVSNHSVRFKDKNGVTGYVHFLTETTREHALMEERLEEAQRIFDIAARHSDHIFYVYDLDSRTTRPWDEENQKQDILADLYAGVYSDEALEGNQAVMPDSMDAAKAFFAAIHGGQPNGEVNLHVKLADGTPKWYHFNYSSIFEGDRPVTALISIEDVTNKHEQEMSHLRFARSISEEVTELMCYVEADLVSDLVEKHTGKHYLASRSFEGERYTDFWRDGFSGLTGGEDALALYSAENLLRLWHFGTRELDNVWGLLRGGGRTWVRVRVELMEDTYSGHVKAFVVTTDVTAEQEERIAVTLRADYDAMTGMLRRDTGEERIRACMAADSRRGILMVLDLDDLKGINDNLGHDQGDAAIIGMANTIKKHFRRDDILMRSGGDEFVVFLPGAGESETALRGSLASLMKEFSAVALGKNGERILCCSVGCAVEDKGTDTYDTLFKRADMALYHVKRGGKNNFAFYEPEMDQEDYQLRDQQAEAVVDHTWQGEGLRHLLEVVAAKYPGVILFNLTQDRVRALSVGSNVEETPVMDTVELFWQNWAEYIHPEDRDATIKSLDREHLLALYQAGRRGTRHRFRNREAAGYVWTEVEVGFFRSDAEDVCAFLFFRWEPSSEKDEKPQD